ncbi:MAG: HAMP domain-containing protein [Candidatus Zixiibacteriota bacterium]|nr:MAG: HAMP domain-containing protein [candidate division Zixibacteria bacterium]
MMKDPTREPHRGWAPSVRSKLLIFLCAVSLLPLLLSSRMLVALGGRSARTFREMEVREGLQLAQGMLEASRERLLEGARAVAVWDDLAAYLRHPQPEWPQTSLEGWAPQSYKLDYLSLYDSQGQPVYCWSALPADVALPADSAFLDPDGPLSGLVSTPEHLFMAAAAEVRLDGTLLGRVVFGRQVNHRLLRELRGSREHDLAIYYGDRLLATTDTTHTLLELDPAEFFPNLVPHRETYLYYARKGDRLIGLQTLQNVQGLEVAALGWTTSRTPAGFLQEAIDRMLLSFGLPLIVLVLLAAGILGRWIERPIRRLSRTMEEVRRTGDLTCRVPDAGRDEIASMSRSFNQMLEQIAHQRDELLTFRTMILAMKEGVLIEDPGQQVIYMNPRMEELLGICFEPSGEGEEPFRLEGRITSKRVITEDERGFSTEEVEWTRPDSERVQALKTSGKLEDPSGKVTGILSTFVDVTERNELELELIQASRMAFLGVYSQGIIHNLNGPLNTIMGFASLLCKTQPDAEIPQRIRLDAQRMADLISSLGRRWRRTGESRLELLNLNEIIREELRFLEADLFFKHNVEKVIDLDPALPYLQGIYGDFSHSLLNLLINAIEALADSAVHRLTVRTRHTFQEIVVQIEDSGVGIRQEDMDQIFLPFFSTKRRDRKDGLPSGAGLGLPIARKILEPYGVLFSVRSEVRQGTCFTLHIPLKPGQYESVRHGEFGEVEL